MPPLDTSKPSKGHMDLLDRHPHIGVSEARANFARVVDEARQGQRVIITDHGEPAAAFVSVSDYRILAMLKRLGVYDSVVQKLGLG